MLFSPISTIDETAIGWESQREMLLGKLAGLEDRRGLDGGVRTESVFTFFESRISFHLVVEQ